MRSAGKSALAGLAFTGFAVAGAVAATSLPPVQDAAPPPVPLATPLATMSPVPEPADETAEPTAEPSSPAAEPTTPPPSPEPTEPEPSQPPPRPEPSPTKPGEPPVPPAEPGKPGGPPPRPPAPEPLPELTVDISLSSTSVAPGGALTTTVSVRSVKAAAKGARLSLSASSATVSPSTRSLGDVTGSGEAVTATVAVPSTANGTVTLTALVTAAKGTGGTASRTIVVTGAGVVPPVGGALPSVAPPIAPGGTAPIGLPPVAQPSLAPALQLALPSAALRPGRDNDQQSSLTALQSGWLAALLTGNALILLRLRLQRRTRSEP